MTQTASQKSILVTGDVTLDWHILIEQQPTDPGLLWNPNHFSRLGCQPGCAALVADLVQALLADPALADSTLQKPTLPQESLHPDDRRFHHIYALWSRFKSGSGKAWRVERFLGMDARTDPAGEAAPAGTADVVLIDDANLGFREDPDRWPAAITGEGEKPDWIVIKMSQPIAQGALWDHLQAHFMDRLIPLVPVTDLRHTEVHISRGLSWERTAQDAAWELVYNPCVNALSACPALLVSFGPAGVMLMQNNTADESAGPNFTLCFDPQLIEGMWQEQQDGHMIGYNTCLMGSLADQLLRQPKNPDWRQAVQSGLSAMRALYDHGYQKEDHLTFPAAPAAQAIQQGGADFAAVPVQNPVYTYDADADHEGGGEHIPQGWWTMLEDQHRDNLEGLARQVVLKGAKAALRDVPQGRFGYLLTVDRREIESFRSIHALASEYLSKGHQKRPLSIAVFGAPGSGKSFGITQVAKTLAPGRLAVLEFNLSQFGGPEEIIDALHQVRDVSLSGQIPLVFWDEFDSTLDGRPLGWLRYFLAPMQDGAFRQGQITHPIGRALFVFAGGTSHRMDGFGQGLPEEERRAAKVPDFISRLKGYVNILGPNPPADAAESDPYHIIRRAILIRSLLERGAPQLFDGQGHLRIDAGVLDAFLGVSRFKHGIRSMESIIAMSHLAGKTAYERSSLPAEDQLDLHVVSKEFLSRVQMLKLEGPLLEKLARTYHHFYQQHQAGAKPAEEADREDSSETAWANLPEDEKAQNRDAVRDIPEKLARIGFVMIPSRSDQPIFKFPEKDDDLELLSRLEHERWMAGKLAAGWRYGPRTIKKDLIHENLLPWEKLSETDKDKDRALVRAIPQILAQAGYAMVRVARD